MVKNPNWQEANGPNLLAILTNVVEDLNSGQTRTNPASGRGGT